MLYVEEIYQKNKQLLERFNFFKDPFWYTRIEEEQEKEDFCEQFCIATDDCDMTIDTHLGIIDLDFRFNKIDKIVSLTKDGLMYLQSEYIAHGYCINKKHINYYWIDKQLK